MKILIVGADKTYSIENFYVRYFRQQGIIVSFCPAHTMFIDFYKNVINRITFRLGLSSIYKKINSVFIEMVKKEQPEIIWVFKGMELFPSSLEWARLQGAKIANYNPDNPFLFSGRGSGNRNISDSVNLYDLHFTYNLATQKLFKEKLNVDAVLLPFGFDIDEDVYQAGLDLDEILRACFLGNPDKGRADFIRQLAENGIPVSVYGHRWEKFLNHPRVSIHSPVYGADVWKVLRQYRVQLNLMRPHNMDSHNMRTFEVTAVGGLMVAPETHEHRLFFEDGKEAFFFKDVTHCIELIRTILKFSAEKTLDIRNAARKRSINSGYSYQSRATQALLHLKSLLK